jgi:hypothetical protein
LNAHRAHFSDGVIDLKEQEEAALCMRPFHVEHNLHLGEPFAQDIAVAV